MMPLTNQPPPSHGSGVSGHAAADSLSDAQRRRYARHLALAQLGATGQETLLAARVLVVGAGGLGSPVLAYLAAAGVGRLGIVDDDVVETSNLQRQVIHRDDAVGSAKAESAAVFVHGLNPEIEVVPHVTRLGVAEALDIVPGYDLVVDGTDNFETRYLLNDVCVLLGLPLVWASLAELSGQLGVVDPGAGPCYRCVFPQAPAPGTVPNCAEGGVLGVLPGVVGSLQATEVVKTLTGLGEPMTRGMLWYDAASATMSTVAAVPDPRCPACGEAARPEALLETDAVLVAQVGAEEARHADLVVDVREPDESRSQPWPAAVERPLSRWTDASVDALVREVGGLDGGLVVLLCASGARSAAGVERLVRAGVDPRRVASLRGGMHALGGESGTR